MPRTITDRFCESNAPRVRGKRLFLTYERKGDGLVLADVGDPGDDDDGLTSESRARKLLRKDPLTRKM